jgi:hypothetical protein
MPERQTPRIGRYLEGAVRSQLVRRLRTSRLGLPSWMDDAAETLPVLDFLVFFIASAGLAVTAEVVNQSWLLPVAGWTAVLGFVVFPLDWTAKFLRRVGSHTHAATWCVVAILAAFVIVGSQVVKPILTHLSGVGQSAAFDLIDIHCQNGKTNTTPQETLEMNENTLRLYKLGTTPPFWDMQNWEPAPPIMSVATCTVTNDGQAPLFNVRLSLAWQVVHNNEKADGLNKDQYSLFILKVAHAQRVSFRFVNNLHGNRAIAIAPTLYCWLQPPGEEEPQVCRLTRIPGIEIHDPSWKGLKENPTFLFPNIFLNKRLPQSLRQALQ